MYPLMAALEIQEHLLSSMQVIFKLKMLQFRYQKKWEISLAVSIVFDPSTLPPKGEIVTFIVGELPAWLACGANSVSQFSPSLHRVAQGSLWAKTERLEVKPKLSVHTDVKKTSED